jgi:hypothetical protein
MYPNREAFMSNVIEATYDGRAPDEPLELEPNTRVRITVETVLPNGSEPPSVLDVALSLDLKGPPDWATNIDQYLYGNLSESEEDGPDDVK